ncbi:DUF6711 family protein [Lacrimispora brassicae]
MAFQGWLVRFGNTVLPNSYLEKYDETPNQRLELDAYRESATAGLRRTTSPYFKSKIEIPIRKLYYGEKIVLKAIVDSGITNAVERKVNIIYWNSEIMDYASGEFYMPDIKYTISHIDRNRLNMVYEPFTITLIEY